MAEYAAAVGMLVVTAANVARAMLDPIQWRFASSVWRNIMRDRYTAAAAQRAYDIAAGLVAVCECTPDETCLQHRIQLGPHRLRDDGSRRPALVEDRAMSFTAEWARAMSDFTRAWANAHDEECEIAEYIRRYPEGPREKVACHCYRRWLEARLGEYGKMLDELIPLARSLWQMVDDSDIGHRALRPETKRLIDECAIRRASQLLSPKGAGDE